MRQLKASKPYSTGSTWTQKQAQALPCSRATGRNRALRHKSGKERLLHKYSTFLRRTLPTKTKPAPKKQLHLSPRAADEIFQPLAKRPIPSKMRQWQKGQGSAQVAPRACLLRPGPLSQPADYTVRPTGGAYNLFLISRASFSAHSSYAHPVGHHQEVMHTKGKLFETPTTNFSGWYARPIAPYRRPVRAGFQSIQRRGMRISAYTRACTRPR